MPIKKALFNGMTPEQYFLQSKQYQANGAVNLVYLFRLAFEDDFGFTIGWAYELMKKFIKKYEDLGQLRSEKVEYIALDWNGKEKKFKDIEFWWNPELLPQPNED